MKNLLAEKRLTAAQILLVVWIIFSAVYVVQDLWREGVQAAYQTGQQSGAQMAESNIAGAIMRDAQECKAIPLTVGEAQVELIATSCLQQAGAPEAGPAPQ